MGEIVRGDNGVEFELGEKIGEIDARGNMTCGRCGRNTHNSNQGHYWSFCKVTGQVRGFHFCCPGNCQLEEPSV